MAGTFRVVPKINGNHIGIFIIMQSTGENRQVGLIETPNDYQVNDDMALAEEICKLYRKRVRKSVNT